ncbi:Os03g0176500 [Oryza sativa Japonica Group]|uniref:Expressed protein n=2 Tax=Oryza sativa subsp. japonica TaxID=39947 RepID=Q10R06_ORYSJ|nr:expressed protein [Oryza sativa Japonica Group]KAB8090451.1 hypothetical protein EE612_015632 [Oryza sativa]BAF11052.1 Os03g0176500 [Oryza sativa Japonica Group]BAG95036.1 unnamed protein product [Oryza sativa Japonica Group]BAS82577.1 Os03g0176500 [Oryza sativa Japonica Group]|eukprot:NP_001049138.1 Os03g0176500 [Oryza sativa Japonica Group]
MSTTAQRREASELRPSLSSVPSPAAATNEKQKCNIKEGSVERTRLTRSESGTNTEERHHHCRRQGRRRHPPLLPRSLSPAVVAVVCAVAIRCHHHRGRRV